MVQDAQIGTLQPHVAAAKGDDVLSASVPLPPSTMYWECPQLRGRTKLSGHIGAWHGACTLTSVPRLMPPPASRCVGTAVQPSDVHAPSDQGCPFLALAGGDCRL